MHRERIKRLRIAREDAWLAAITKLRGRYNPERDAIRSRQARQRADLKDRQSRLHIRLLRILDITGTARRKQEAARRLLSARHKAARKKLSVRYRKARTKAEDAVKTRYAAAIERTECERRKERAALMKRHEQMAQHDDAQRQQREIEREHIRRITEAKIEAWRKERKDGRPLGIESSFAQALRRAAEQEADRSSRRGKDDDVDRER